MHYHEMVKNGLRGASSGEGFVYAELLFIIISGIFFLVILINAIFRKDIIVYAWLCVIVVTQALVALNAG